MRPFTTRNLLLILFTLFGINVARADYWSAGSYNGHFQFTKVELTLNEPWIQWRFPNYDYNGIDDALRYSHWYVGGSKAGWETYRLKPSEYFYTPFWPGTEVVYMDSTHGVTKRLNEEYGVCDVINKEVISDIRTHEIKFWPGQLMGPEDMTYFYVRWTGWWDIDDNAGNGYWIGQGESSLGNKVDGSAWQGPGIQHRGNGVARYVQVKYNIPITEKATFTRKPGGKIDVSISGNDHKDWSEYYGFSNSSATDEHGYYINKYGNVDLTNGKATYTIPDTFDETKSVIIYYHQYYKRSEKISGQSASPRPSISIFRRL